jgi:UDP-N-acetylglucosamine acyltransferase
MIHQHTVIHPNAKIGKNVRIDAFTTIEEDVVIGDNTWISSNVRIMNGARIGNHCQIFHGAIISAPPADLKFNGEHTTAEIGDHTIIREFVSIHRGTKDKMKTLIGSNCLIMAYCHIAHDCKLGDHCIMSNSTQLAGHVTLGNYVIVSGMCGVNQFVSIGDHAYIGGFTTVRKDVPPFVRAGNIPTNFSGINSVGLRRRGYSSEEINQIMDIYRVVYNSNLNVTQALKKLEELPESDIKAQIFDFIKESKRGIIRAASKIKSDEDTGD